MGKNNKYNFLIQSLRETKCMSSDGHLRNFFPVINDSKTQTSIFYI